MTTTSETSTITATTLTDPTVRLAGEDRDDTIEGYELRAARRALSLLKSTLGRERLLELLSAEIAGGTAYLREHVERSAGEEISGTTVLRAHGTTATGFTGWLAQAFGREDVLIAGHPEHYSIHASGGRVNIVETLGAHVCSFFMSPWNDATDPASTAPASTAPASTAPASTAPAGDDGATHRRRSRMALEDGTVVGSIANSFFDEQDGFSVHLSVTLPATCGHEVVEHHLEHFAVEFRSWILRAAQELTPDRR
ncbi:MAG: hypothetical protein M3Y71_16465 [Actinomycetota bacterium]|nr:hypothetical protein [Actinomycetota bacterium]